MKVDNKPFLKARMDFHLELLKILSYCANFLRKRWKGMKPFFLFFF